MADVLLRALLHVPPYGPGIVRGLHEGRHERQRVGPLDRGVRLIGQVRVQPSADLVVKIGPPSWTLRGGHPPPQALGPRGPVDPVIVDNVPDVARQGLALGIFQPRQLARGDHQVRGHLVQELPGLSPKLPHNGRDAAPRAERAGHLVHGRVLSCLAESLAWRPFRSGNPTAQPYSLPVGAAAIRPWTRPSRASRALTGHDLGREMPHTSQGGPPRPRVWDLYKWESHKYELHDGFPERASREDRQAGTSRCIPHRSREDPRERPPGGAPPPRRRPHPVVGGTAGPAPPRG